MLLLGSNIPNAKGRLLWVIHSHPSWCTQTDVTIIYLVSSYWRDKRGSLGIPRLLEIGRVGTKNWKRESVVAASEGRARDERTRPSCNRWKSITYWSIVLSNDPCLDGTNNQTNLRRTSSSTTEEGARYRLTMKGQQATASRVEAGHASTHAALSLSVSLQGRKSKVYPTDYYSLLILYLYHVYFPPQWLYYTQYTILRYRLYITMSEFTCLPSHLLRTINIGSIIQHNNQIKTKKAKTKIRKNASCSKKNSRAPDLLR